MAEICASAAPISTKNTSLEETRRSITYHPSVWRDHFLAYTSSVTEITGIEGEQLEKQKHKVNKLLAQIPDDSTLKIELIDAIQRLGVGYHFEKEIDDSLRQIWHTYQIQSSKENDDVRTVALRFRLLRQQGYHVTSDVFNNFIDDQGNFKESLINDVEGMLSLYEASNYAVNDEEIMDKALEFCYSHLESLLPELTNTSLSKRVKEALEMPIHKTLIRLGATKFMPVYQEDESHNKDLLNFAKLDFNIVQKGHQKELYDITRWWEDLNFANKLPFARDRVVECYFWILGVYFEPQYNTARRLLTKVISMTSILDDIYDVHGTLDELRRFTEAIPSWDISAVDGLPEYMRTCFEALLGVYDEMEDEMLKQGKLYRVQYAKQEMVKLVKAYMGEAEWCYSKYVPTTDEYMKQATISAGYMMLEITSFVGMGDAITKHDFDWMATQPPILEASAAISRLMDDIVGHGIEQKISVIDCYMKENGCSDMEAISELSKRVKKLWKDINEEWVKPGAASMAVLVRVINLTRVLCIIYAGDDGYTNSTTRIKDFVKVVLVDPVLLE
ncbi:hypothetical protein C2S52_009990 [Perilla frutescens var. hirtella]|nr:hypothetical protein C2S52_009990 [Perilla frutescens var. hirtella]